MIRVLKNIRYTLVGFVVSVFDTLIPKRRASFAFCVGRGNVFSGNLKAIFDYFYQNHQGTILLFAHSGSDLDLCEDEYCRVVVQTNSIKGLWELLRTRCIVVEYGSCDWFWPGLIPFRHLFVNLWHGIPVKRVGFAENAGAGMRRESRFIDCCIASSHIDRAMMSSCFRVGYDDVLLVGYPRNDWLNADVDNVESVKLGELENEIIRQKAGRKLVLYAPTFRGHFASKEDSNNGVYPFLEEELIRLKMLLVEHNAVLGIRPHLNKNSDSRIPYDDVIIDMGRSVVSDVQVLLRNTDVLISDYSGVWVDYLLMDRPIIGFVHDWASYQSARGYLYDYKSIFPGDLVETSEEFFESLRRLLSEGESERCVAKRNFSKKIFHWRNDGKARERLFNELVKKAEM